MLHRTLTLAAAAALLAGGAFAQAPASPPASPPNNSPAQAPAAAAPAEAGAPAAGEAPAADAPAAAPPSAAAQAFKPITASGDLAATLRASGQFSKFLAASEKAGLTGLLTGARPLTLFVPTDAAVEGTPLANVESMTVEQLRPILLQHVHAQRIAPDQIAGKKGPVPMASQKTVEIDGSATPMKVGEAVVLQADVGATNGAIYVIDRVLPST